jgi:hypothetical protein
MTFHVGTEHGGELAFKALLGLGIPPQLLVAGEKEEDL